MRYSKKKSINNEAEVIDEGTARWKREDSPVRWVAGGLPVILYQNVETGFPEQTG